MNKSISEVQTDIEAALERLAELAPKLPEALKPLVKLAPPKGARAQVSLLHSKSKRQVKRNAPADTWSAGSGLVSISYATSVANEEARTVENPDPARELVLALARAEVDPQLGFVSLKWFRDTYLPRQGHTWADAAEDRQRVLVDAIGRQWILTSKVPNPKNPQFPVTAVRVNRQLAEVRGMLSQQPGFGSRFSPIAIQGESLSETVSRERR